MLNQPIDQLPLWAVLALIIIGLFFAAEAGFYIGKRRSSKIADIGREEKQASSIMGASLGLLAFLLAFTFAMANSIHGERKELVVTEANAIGTLYLRSQLFENSPQMTQSQQLIRDYVKLRLEGGNWRATDGMAEIQKILRASENILDQLWVLGREMTPAHVNSPLFSLYIDSLNEVIDIHTLRINAGSKRLPQIVRVMLFMIATVTLALLGYQSGLNLVRALIPRAALITSLSIVMVLVVDLDRPGSDLISIGQNTMLNLQTAISEAKP